MKVKCKNIYNEHTKKLQDTSLWITIDKEYIVLEIEIYPTKKILYRLVGDNKNKMPALYDASQFSIVTEGLPKNWKISQLKDDILIAGPKAWQPLGFWEDCYDLKPDALEIYKREARIIYAEEDTSSASSIK
jgi:hypothetical protein